MLQHVSLEVFPEDCDPFGELLEAIGFRTLGAPAALGDVVRWYGRRGTQVHLILTPAARAPTLGHAAFLVEDFGATIAALTERGFEPEPAREHWGTPRAFVPAPSGHRVELMVAAPPG